MTLKRDIGAKLAGILVPLLLVGSLAGFTFSTCAPANICDVFDNSIPILDPVEFQPEHDIRGSGYARRLSRLRLCRIR